ncbi:hypothetical protein EDC96DRAFT_330978 [Choanephora cucurbitarum]|nr:hypothetical protein EDC96DRAFT_330978 [Choanephora cucurbitarum]
MILIGFPSFILIVTQQLHAKLGSSFSNFYNTFQWIENILNKPLQNQQIWFYRILFQPGSCVASHVLITVYS